MDNPYTSPRHANPAQPTAAPAKVHKRSVVADTFVAFVIVSLLAQLILPASQMGTGASSESVPVFDSLIDAFPETMLGMVMASIGVGAAMSSLAWVVQRIYKALFLR